MTASSRPTMASLARELGIAQSTVSMALRNHPGISEATQQRVREAAEKRGYRPDPLVSALMAQRKGKRRTESMGTLAVISLWPDPGNSFLTLPYFEPYREGIQERARELGYSVDSFPCDGSPQEAKRLLQVLRARGIQGLVFGQAHESMTTAPFPLSEFSAACIANVIQAPVLSRVESNHYAEMSLACETLRKEGCRRTGYFYMENNRASNQGRRLGAYLNASQDVPARNRLPPLVVTNAEDLRPVEAWLRRHKPDAVISERGDMMLRLRRKYPDIRWVSLTVANLESLEGIFPARHAVGAGAVDMVVAQLHRGERGPPTLPKTVQIVGRWVGRDQLRG